MSFVDELRLLSDPVYHAKLEEEKRSEALAERKRKDNEAYALAEKERKAQEERTQREAEERKNRIKSYATKFVNRFYNECKKVANPNTRSYTMVLADGTITVNDNLYECVYGDYDYYDAYDDDYYGVDSLKDDFYEWNFEKKGKYRRTTNQMCKAKFNTMYSQLQLYTPYARFGYSHEDMVNSCIFWEEIKAIDERNRKKSKFWRSKSRWYLCHQYDIGKSYDIPKPINFQHELPEIQLYIIESLNRIGFSSNMVRLINIKSYVEELLIKEGCSLTYYYKDREYIEKGTAIEITASW